MPRPQANFLRIDWPMSRATPFLLSNLPLLGTAHPTRATSCPTGNYITTRGWKFHLLSRLDLSKPLIFWAGAGCLWHPCPLLKKYYWLSSIMSPNCEGTSKLDGILFFGDSVLNDLSVLNTLFLCFHTFQSRQKKSNLMLTFSRENLAHAQCSVFHMCCPRIFDKSGSKIHCHNLPQRRKVKAGRTVRQQRMLTRAACCQVTSSSKIEPLFGDLPAFSKTS